MPRPLSMTVMLLSSWMIISIFVQYPASASSMLVIDDFPYQMVQALCAGGTDIHTGRLRTASAFQHLNLAFIICTYSEFAMSCLHLPSIVIAESCSSWITLPASSMMSSRFFSVEERSANNRSDLGHDDRFDSSSPTDFHVLVLLRMAMNCLDSLEDCSIEISKIATVPPHESSFSADMYIHGFTLRSLIVSITCELAILLDIKQRHAAADALTLSSPVVVMNVCTLL